MTVDVLIEKIKNGGYNAIFKDLYGETEKPTARALALAESFKAQFGSDTDGAELFSSPARVELIGNHTDHAGGKAVAATIREDILAIAAPHPTRVALYGEAVVELELDGEECKESERGTSAALARGMAHRFGGGFVGVTNSRIPLGVGLGSSAAYTLLCAKIADTFHSGGNTAPVSLALAAAMAENLYYGKKSGMLDQLAVAYGGVNCIDFITPVPTVRPGKVSLGAYGIYLVNTGETHINKDVLYGRIASDMATAAAAFGCDRLGQVSAEEFKQRGEMLRPRCGERVFRSAQHFFGENLRVSFFARNMEAGLTDRALYAVNGSGISSRANLGNVHERAKELTAALKDVAAAIRIHGGGFGGAVMCYVADDKRQQLCQIAEGLFGKNCVIPVVLRNTGVCKL